MGVKSLEEFAMKRRAKRALTQMVDRFVIAKEMNVLPSTLRPIHYWCLARVYETPQGDRIRIGVDYLELPDGEKLELGWGSDEYQRRKAKLVDETKQNSSSVYRKVREIT